MERGGARRPTNRAGRDSRRQKVLRSRSGLSPNARCGHHAVPPIPRPLTRVGYMSDCRVRPYADTDRGHLRLMMNALQAAERMMEPDRADWPDRADSYVALVLAEISGKRGAIFVAETPASDLL